jgi:hypothetical protein
MTIEKLAYISEIISGIVVATTLIIVAYQMRQNNRREQAEALRETVNDFIGGIVQATATENDAENFRNGVHNFDELSSTEKARFHSTMLNMAARFDQVLNLYESKRLGKTHFEGAQRTYITIMKTPGAQQWWNAFKHDPPKSLVEHIDQAVADPSLNIRAAHEIYPWLVLERAER